MRKILCTALFMFFSLLSFTQTKISEVSFPETFMAGNDKLLFNGGGTREKYWMDMYVVALYLPVKSKDAASIVAGNSSMAIRICIISGLITSERMIEAVDEGFEKSTGGKPEAYKDRIEMFQRAFSDKIEKGDVFDIIYLNETVSIYLNGKLKAAIKGLDFKKAVFGIWLGPDPADEELKKGMLGINE